MKPDRGVGHYLRDIVYGALDGVITTLAVVSAATGAALEPRVGLVLGLANLAADGISMGASNYLGLKSELDQTGASVSREMPWRHGLATSAAFITIGAVPLIAYFLPRRPPVTVLHLAVLLAVIALATAGSLRSRFTRKPAWLSAAEMLGVGAVASTAAYSVGALARSLLA